jgi:hypothetical protein
MTWIVVDLSQTENNMDNSIHRTKYRYACRKYLRDNLSSDGVLWKSDWNTSVYFFAQPQDALIFKLRFMNLSVVS